MMNRYLLQYMKRCLSPGCFFILFIYHVVCAGNAGASDLPSLELPEPTGPYGIGTTLLHLTDTSRLEEMTPDPNDHREIMVQMWYPAAKTPSGKTFPYMDAQTAAFCFPNQQAVIEAIATHAIEARPPVEAADPFPLLIFSPGLGAVSATYQSFIEDIVSHGYVVAAVNHPFISGITVFPDGRVIHAADIDSDFEAIASILPLVVEDIQFLTGQLESVKIGDATLNPDVNNIGFFGHSLGGSASVEACLQIPQGQCAMNIDGSLFGQSHQQPIEKPLFFMMKEDQTPFFDPSLSAAWRNISHDGYLVNLDGAEHHTFADLGILLYQLYGPDYFDITKELVDDTGRIAPQKAIQITREYMVAFFDSYLKDAPPNGLAAISHSEAALVQAGPADEYEGAWRSVGFGTFMQIEDSDVTMFEISQAGMLPYMQGRIHNHFVYVGDQAVFQVSRSEENVIMRLGGTDYTFKPVEAASLPPILDQTDDPELNFEVFWQTFEEHCALFDLVDVDWKALYEEYRPRVTPATTKDELFDLFSSLIVPLNDGHTYIEDPDSNRYSHSGPNPKAMWTQNRAGYLENIAKYMDGGQLESEGNDLIRYGVIDGSIGYLGILAFGGYQETDGEISPAFKYERMAFDAAIDAVLGKIGHLDAMIVDVRFNGGGYDDLALALAGRFAEEKITAFTKRVRIGGYDDFSTPMSRDVEPTRSASFTSKPVVLLTSGGTISAAEVFTMAMEQVGDVVTLIGENTYGAFSNVLGRKLPNGWEFGLSNERYLTPQGVDYEQQGVSPDIEVTYPSTMLEEGKDSALDRGIEHINSSNAPDGADDKDDKDEYSCFIISCMN